MPTVSVVLYVIGVAHALVAITENTSVTVCVHICLHTYGRRTDGQTDRQHTQPYFAACKHACVHTHRITQLHAPA